MSKRPFNPVMVWEAAWLASHTAMSDEEIALWLRREHRVTRRWCDEAARVGRTLAASVFSKKGKDGVE